MDGILSDRIVAVIGSLAGVAGAWFAYIPIRRRRRRADNQPATPAPTDIRSGATASRFDAFIAYATEDTDRAIGLARGLENRGLRVFLAEWIGLGLLHTIEKQEALARSANGVLLFTRTTMQRPAMVDDYAAILGRVHAGGRRFVPVLLEKVDLPAYAKSRRALDLTDPRQEEAKLDQLANALRPDPEPESTAGQNRELGPGGRGAGPHPAG